MVMEEKLVMSYFILLQIMFLLLHPRILPSNYGILKKVKKNKNLKVSRILYNQCLGIGTVVCWLLHAVTKNFGFLMYDLIRWFKKPQVIRVLRDPESYGLVTPKDL